MKHLITFLLALASTFAQAQATGDYLFQRKSASAFTSIWLTPSGTNLIGFNGSGGLTSVAQSTFLTPAQGNAAYSLLGHTHTASQVTDFNTAGDARWALISHTHGPADLTGFGANGGYLRSNGTAWVRVSGIAWADLTSVPAPVTALTGTNTGDQTITLTGDVTGSGTGSFAATIANQVVTFAKMQHIASAHLLGRHGSGNGDVQQINIDGGLELQGANLRRAALTGDVTTSAGSNATTIANDAVTNAKAANMAQATVKGRASGAGTGDPTDLTPDQVSTILDGATNPFLRTSAATSGITQLTGDVTAGPGSGSQAATLASVITAGGPTGSASVVPVITYDAKGRLTTVTTATITPAAIGAPSGSGTSSGTNTGDQTITLTGNVTGSGTGSFATTIAAGSVTLAKQADVATGTVFYRKTALAGSPEVQTLATLKTDLGLTGTNSGDQTSIVGITGTVAQFNTAITDGDLATGGGTATGTNTGDQTITLTGAVTGSGTGSFTTSYGDVEISSIAGLVSAADRLPYYTGSGTASLATFTGAGRNLVDDADNTAQRTTLGLGTLATQSGTFSGTSSGTNSGDVTLAGTPTYITIAGQTITRGQVGLTTDVTGRLPFANLVQGTAGSRLIGTRASGPGSFEEITLGTGLSMSSSTLNGLPDQTIANSSDATSHTVTLSASGGSVQLIEGTNITLTTGGTSGAGTVTINASGGGGFDANKTMAYTAAY
jgi:hypothetical protein